jgi:hypothetical protein
MANETTTTTLTETVNSEFITLLFQDYAGHYANPIQFAYEYTSGNGSPTVAVPRWDSDEGSPYDRGTGVDTEFNGTEATDLANRAMSTSESTITAAEYGLMRTVTDHALEDSVASGQLFNAIMMKAASALTAAKNDDMCALFASLSNTSGSTGVNCSVADVDDALYDLAERTVIGSLVGIFDHQALRDFQDNLTSVGGSSVVYPAAAAALMNLAATPDNGRSAAGLVLNYKGVDIYRNDLTDTVNAGADVCSAIMVRGDVPANQPTACFGSVTKRAFRMEMQRDASLRGTELVFTERWGVAETLDNSGQRIVSDAP